MPRRNVTQPMVDRGVEAMRELFKAAAPEEIRFDTPRKVAEIPFGEITFETLVSTVLRAALREERR